MKSKFCFFVGLLFSFTTALSQNKTVTGHVTSGAGEPLLGVTVSVKGTKTVTATGASGDYSISVPASGNPVLEFSFVGSKTQQIPVAGRSVINITLQTTASTLNDVVVVGYGTVRRKDLTGSVSSVSAKDLKDIPINSAEEALAGRLAGVQVTGSEGSPDAQVQIRVRGGGSITQDNSPLYVVDGIVVDNALSTLSPQDIESIDVLKDASATAIYGARGANGVVIITTKGGHRGKSTVSYNGLVGVQKVPHELSVMNPYDFVIYQYERSRGSSQNEANFLNTYGTWNDLSLYKQAPFVDWQNQVFGREAFMQTHNISISGGEEKTQFNLSLTYNKNEAVMLNSDYDRKLVNFRLNHEVSKNFKVGFNVRFDNQVINGAGTSNPGSSGLNFLRQAVRYIPYLSPGQEVANYDPELINETSGNGLYIVNPLLLINSQYKRQYQTLAGLSGYADYTLTRFLSFRTTVGFDYHDYRTNSYDDSLSSNSISNGSGMPIATVQQSNRQTFDNSNVFTFSNRRFNGTFNENNTFDFIAGQETYETRNTDKTIIQRFFPLGTTAEKALGNLNLASPPTGIAEPAPTSDEDVQRISSFFGRLNYGYKDKYLASLSMRADGSSVFAPGRQWGYFPAASFAWKLSEEKFMQSLEPFISNVKLRLNYGEAGNNRIQSFLFLTQFNTQQNYYGLQNQLVTAFGSVGLSNALLTWESNVSRNAGLDFSLFNNHVQFSLDYYRNKTKNLLVSVPVPTTSGYTTQIQNVGATSNNGFEGQVSATVIQKRNFSWNASFNISFNQNKVLSLGKQTSFLQSSGWAGSNNPADYIIKVGAPVGSMYGLVNDGYYTVDDFNYDATKNVYVLKQGVPNDVSVTGLNPQPGIIKYKDLNGDSVVNSKDERIIGNANPKFFGGLNQQFQYKNFDLSIFINFQYGNDIYNDNKLEFGSGYTPNANLLSIENNRWKTIDANGNVVTDPKALANLNKNATLWQPITTGSAFYPQSWAVEDGSFIRINNITFGYSLPSSLIKKMRMQRFRAYVTVNNLAVITNYSGYDPEVNTRRSTPMTPGVDFSAYPRSTSYIFGLNVTF
ncbi:MAG TPA: TonB-dependent receptor [Hanamia sp.]|nr:TonB-dependent receptor [Hanamia sp.]